MASIDKIKGRYFFGVDEATSIIPQAGSGNLIPIAGVGVPVYKPNYVELKQGNRFKTPFNSTPRNRTIIMAHVRNFTEMGYDAVAATTHFPTVGSPMMPLNASSLMMAWATDGYLSSAGSNLSCSLEGGSALVQVTNGFQAPMSYRDGTYNWNPGLSIIGQGDEASGVYLAATIDRNLQWEFDKTPYTGSGSPKTPTIIGSTYYNGGAGAVANDHCFLLAFAEYSYLTKAEALEAASEMVAILITRGWKNAYEYPVRSNPSDPGGTGELVPPSSVQPSIVAVNANFTVAASPVSGWTRITKVGGTSGTFERAATSSAALARHWLLGIRDVSETADFFAGTVPQATPAQAISGWQPNGGSGATSFLVLIKGAYAGSNRPRVLGMTLGATRAASPAGYVAYITGEDKIDPPWKAADSTQGTTDAAVPMLFACELKTIGGYIDVKLS